MEIQNKKKGIVMMSVLLLFVSCGSQKPMVDDINISTVMVDGDLHLTLAADLAIGKLILPSVTIPIILPKNGKEIGYVSMARNLKQVNRLIVNLNVSETANLEFAQARLPNGVMVPLIVDHEVLSTPVGKVTIYLSVLKGAEAVGVAIPIKNFDSIGRKVGTSALMPIFQNNNIIGAAGIFTSKTKGQNGFALIAGLSGIVNGELISNAFLADVSNAKLEYNSLIPSRKAEKRINSELYKLHKKGRQLKLRY